MQSSILYYTIPGWRDVTYFIDLSTIFFFLIQAIKRNKVFLDKIYYWQSTYRQISICCAAMIHNPRKPVEQSINYKLPALGTHTQHSYTSLATSSATYYKRERAPLFPPYMYTPAISHFSLWRCYNSRLLLIYKLSLYLAYTPNSRGSHQTLFIRFPSSAPTLHRCVCARIYMYIGDWWIRGSNCRSSTWLALLFYVLFVFRPLDYTHWLSIDI